MRSLIQQVEKKRRRGMWERWGKMNAELEIQDENEKDVGTDFIWSWRMGVGEP